MNQSMALRGDNDIFSLMDQMSSQQGYPTQTKKENKTQDNGTTELATNKSAVRLVPEIKNYPSNKSVGSRAIWNPYVTVHSASEAIILAPSNPQVEVFRRRAYERLKEEIREMFDRANGNSKKEGANHMWTELSIPSLIERWQFDAKLQEYLSRTTIPKSSSCQPSGLWTTSQVQGFILAARASHTWIDPILVSSRTPKRSLLNPLTEEVKFEWLRAWRKKCGDKTRDGEILGTFASKKFHRKTIMLSRCIRESTMTIDTKMMEEIRKRATLETTQQHGKKQLLPKVTIHDDDIKVSYSGLIFTVHKQHFHKLQIMYDRQNRTSLNREDHEAGFLSALFALLTRYDMLQGAGLQSALQGSVFDYLLNEFDCTMECFASPLNCRYERFCSAFPDTDAIFGSVGSFFDYDFSRGGCYQANPPFVANFILAMYRRMEDSLKTSSEPLMFVVFVPAWTETSGWKSLQSCTYMGHHEWISQSSHYYAEGTQHRRKDRFRVASFDTSVFFLQNDEAKLKWPMSKEQIIKLQEAFANNPDDDEEEEKCITTDIAKEISSKETVVPETNKSFVVPTKQFKMSKKNNKSTTKRKIVAEEQSLQLSIVHSIAEHKKRKT